LDELALAPDILACRVYTKGALRKASGAASNAVTEQSKEAGKQEVAAFAECMELFQPALSQIKAKRIALQLRQCMEAKRARSEPI
jgi:hypothetical protein